MNNDEWWKKAVIYQIYPRSFQDSNGDGIGDLRGIIKRLDYLEMLGIDAIWLSPVYQSPQDDNGYDISDYQSIDPMFGSMEDMDELISEAAKRHISIIMDLVLNHTSDEHRWFQEARKSRDSKYHDYYVWRDGEEGKVPNDMKSCFGGSAWQWVPEVKQYYFHQFSVKQPDLNWDNPKVREELYSMINWWIDKGVGGFRLDVIDQIAKVPDLKITNNGPKLHEYIREMTRETFSRGNLITVGEAWGANTDNAKLFSNPDGSEFSMVFQFEHIMLDQQEGKEKWDLAPLPFLELKKVLAKWQTELHQKGWNSLFWNNHDLPRIVSRWGNDRKYRIESAKMLATLLYGLQGTPYIYQGEELGMTNVCFDNIEDYRDIETLNFYEEKRASGVPVEEIMRAIYAKGRDNARTPMQWGTGKNAGFSTGDPWIKANSNYTEINAESELADPGSIFYYYKKLIALRKKYQVFQDGAFHLLFPEDSGLFVYTRENVTQKLYVVCNFTEQPVDLYGLEREDGVLLICNYPSDDTGVAMRPYEARIYLSEE